MATTATSTANSEPRASPRWRKAMWKLSERTARWHIAGQLDLLPFRCESCRGTYCLDHRSETAHSCPKAGEWARRRNAQNANTKSSLPAKPSLLTHDKQCYEKSCKTLIFTALVTGVHCSNCNRDYCLKHRMEEDHDCKNVKQIGAKPQNALQIQREQGMAAFRRLRAWAEERNKNKKEIKDKETEKKPSGSGISSFFSRNKSTSSPGTGNLAELRELKRTAKGDASVPAQNRIYLHVEASADTTKSKYPTGNFFYNKDWTVGKVLDAAAKALQVQNVNNRGGGEEDKLRVFHVEGGRLLNFSEKIGAHVKTSDMIVLLRGVGDPNLMDVEA